MTIPRSAIRSTAPPAQWLSGTSGNEDCAKAPPAVTAARSVTRNLFILYYPLKLADLAFSAASAERAQSAWSFRVSSRQSSLRSEEHTSELQSRGHLVCRLLLEKKNTAEETCSQ